MEEEKYRLSQNKLRNYNSGIKLKKSYNFYRPKNQSMSRYIHNLKNTEQTRYNNLFYKKKNSPLKKKLSNNNSNRIIIMHEEIQSLNNEQFMKRLGNIENLENDDMMKNAENQILNENLEKLHSENAELKNIIKKLEDKIRENEEKNEIFEKKNNEISKNKLKTIQNNNLVTNEKLKPNDLSDKIIDYLF